jgi:fumarate hydratase class II
MATGMRRERDTVGPIDVPADRYWGAATQRALRALPINAERLPDRFFNCYGYAKRAAAVVNAQAGRLPMWKAAAIARAADDLIAGLLRDQFPLPVYQSGSGFDADANVNEVIANRSAQLLGSPLGKWDPIDPVRDVNLAQSLDAIFSMSMQVATVFEIEEALAPRVSALARAIGRNPNMRPWHGDRLRAALGRLDEAEGSLHDIGSEPGDGTPTTAMTADDWQILVGIIAIDTKRPFIKASGRLSSDAMVAVMAAVRGLAAILYDIADTLRASLGTGRPRQTVAPIDAMSMVCMTVIGLDQIVAATGCRDSALRTALPLVVASVLNAIRSLGEACDVLRRYVTRMR